MQRRQLSERQSKNDTLNRNTITAKLEGKLSDEDFNTMKESIRREASAIEKQRKLLDSEEATMQELIEGSKRYVLNPEDGRQIRFNAHQHPAFRLPRCCH
jgi:hypothetical protein